MQVRAVHGLVGGLHARGVIASGPHTPPSGHSRVGIRNTSPWKFQGQGQGQTMCSNGLFGYSKRDDSLPGMQCIPHKLTGQGDLAHWEGLPRTEKLSLSCASHRVSQVSSEYDARYTQIKCGITATPLLLFCLLTVVRHTLRLWTIQGPSLAQSESTSLSRSHITRAGISFLAWLSPQQPRSMPSDCYVEPATAQPHQVRVLVTSSFVFLRVRMCSFAPRALAALLAVARPPLLCRAHPAACCCPARGRVDRTTVAHALLSRGRTLAHSGAVLAEAW